MLDEVMDKQNLSPRCAQVKKTSIFCDCGEHSLQKNTIFLGVCRAVVSVISLTLAVTFLANFSNFVAQERLVDYHKARSIYNILVVICVVNGLHFFVSIFIFLIARSNIGKPRSIKFWIIIDIAISTVNILSILILLFTIPSKTISLILGTAIATFSLFLGYKSSVVYVLYKSEEGRSF